MQMPLIILSRMSHLHTFLMFRRLILISQGPFQVRIHQGQLLPDLYPRPVSRLTQVSREV